MNKVDVMNKAVEVIIDRGIQSRDVTGQDLINIRKAIVAIVDVINENSQNNK